MANYGDAYSIGQGQYRAAINVYITSQTATTATYRVSSWGELRNIDGWSNAALWRGNWNYSTSTYAWTKKGEGNCSCDYSESWSYTNFDYADYFTVTKGTSATRVYHACEFNCGGGTYSHAGMGLDIPARTSYTISYNANGGSGTMAGTTKYHDVNVSLRENAFSRTGYSFAGWNTKSDGSGTNYADEATYTGNGNVTLYAKWSPKTYTISYNKNGGSGSMSATTGKYNTNVSLRANAFTRSYYTFSKWNTESDGTGTNYSNGASYPVRGNATLYAQWSPNTYTVSYSANGGSGSVASHSRKTTDGALTIKSGSSLSRTHYTFAGWNTKSDGTGTNYSVGQSYSTNANLALYAKWSRITYTITYQPNGGSGTTAQQTKYSGTDIALRNSSFTRAGYEFVKWNTNTSGTGTGYNAGATYTGNANLTLYAVWKPLVVSITSASDVTVGNNCTVKFTPLSTATKFKLQFKLGSKTETTGFITVSSLSAVTHTQAIDASYANQITTAKTGQMTVTLITYDTSGTQLGTSSKTCTVTVPSSFGPTFTVAPTVTRVNTVASIDSWYIYVAGYSKARIQATASASNGATIRSVVIEGALSKTVTGSAATLAVDETSGVLTGGTKTGNKITATDSRGYSVSVSLADINVMPYTPPVVTNFTPTRLSPPDVSTVSVTPTWTYSLMDSHNSTSAVIQRKESDASTWETLSVTVTSGTAILLGNDFTDSKSYDIRLIVADTVGNSYVAAVHLPTISVWEHMPVGGQGVAFGKTSETGNFEINYDLEVYGETITDALTVNEIDYTMTSTEYNELLDLLG